MFLSLGQSAFAIHQQVLSVRASSRPPSVGAAGSAFPGGGGFTIMMGAFLGVEPSSVVVELVSTLFIGPIFLPLVFALSPGGGGFAITVWSVAGSCVFAVLLVASPELVGFRVHEAEAATVTKKGRARVRRFLGDIAGRVSRRPDCRQARRLQAPANKGIQRVGNVSCATSSLAGIEDPEGIDEHRGLAQAELSAGAFDENRCGPVAVVQMIDLHTVSKGNSGHPVGNLPDRIAAQSPANRTSNLLMLAQRIWCSPNSAPGHQNHIADAVQRKGDIDARIAVDLI